MSNTRSVPDLNRDVLAFDRGQTSRPKAIPRRVNQIELPADRARRTLDVALGSALLALCSPLLAAVAFVIRRDSTGTALYRQIRVGRNGDRFEILKFRTMVEDAESDGMACLAQHRDPRVTRVGRFLRATRIDELPQLINVLRGDMSLVGPRPERPEFVSGFEKSVPDYELRHLVRPGLTGPAQIRLGYDATPGDKLVHDLSFVRDPSIVRYLTTMASTPLAVVAWIRCAGSSCPPPADETDAEPAGSNNVLGTDTSQGASTASSTA